MASSASMLQCSFTGGSERCFAMAVFWTARASSSVLPLIHSVARELLAIAEPQPKVLKVAFTIFPLSSTSICSFITSPQAGAPTKPVPTRGEFLSREPLEENNILIPGYRLWTIRPNTYHISGILIMIDHTLMIKSPTTQGRRRAKKGTGYEAVRSRPEASAVHCGFFVGMFFALTPCIFLRRACKSPHKVNQKPACFPQFIASSSSRTGGMKRKEGQWLHFPSIPSHSPHSLMHAVETVKNWTPFSVRPEDRSSRLHHKKALNSILSTWWRLVPEITNEFHDWAGCTEFAAIFL